MPKIPANLVAKGLLILFGSSLLLFTIGPVYFALLLFVLILVMAMKEKVTPSIAKKPEVATVYKKRVDGGSLPGKAGNQRKVSRPHQPADGGITKKWW